VEILSDVFFGKFDASISPVLSMHKPLNVIHLALGDGCKAINSLVLQNETDDKFMLAVLNF